MVVAHIILVKAKPETTEELAQEVLKDIAGLKDSLPNLIESVHLGVNFSPRSRGYTHGFTMIFKDRAALDQYATAPEHVKIIHERIHPHFDDTLAFDYDVAEYSNPRLH